jgi:alpha-tubulin suppressor-like RCC1 family protein
MTEFDAPGAQPTSRLGWAMAAMVPCIIACSDVAGPEQAVAYIDVQAGGSHTCALSEDGRTFCWGYNPGVFLDSGPRTDVSVEERMLPQPIDGDPRFVAIRAGEDFACGLSVVGRIYCWGRNQSGQLGNGELWRPGEVLFRAEPMATPQTFAGLADLVATAHACALDTAGAAYCWGHSWRLTLGTGSRGDTLPQPVPVPVAGGHTFDMIAAGPAETCAISPPGAALYCWGADGSRLNFARADDRPEPVLILTPVPFDTIGVGEDFVCGLADETAYCRGWNDNGALGTGDTMSRGEFAPVVGGFRFTALSVGPQHACGLSPGGAAYCWGLGTYGRLGDGEKESRASPVAVAGGLTFRRISAGRRHTCGLTDAGAIYCWGDGFYGALGTGAREDSPVPVPIAPVRK